MADIEAYYDFVKGTFKTANQQPYGTLLTALIIPITVITFIALIKSAGPVDIESY